jgi:hypothetical protein
MLVVMSVLASVVDDDDVQTDSNVAGSSDYYIYQRDMLAVT